MNLLWRTTACGLAFLTSLSLPAQQSAPPNGIPHLQQNGQATQLIVDGKPFLMLAGELLNSSSSSLDYMKPEWPQLAQMGLNTVLTPVSWELVEPTEGKYDFTLVDGLLAQAREQHLHIVFLWLAAWKNGMSGYPPVWVKEDLQRFPRAMLNGQPTPILSTFSPNLRDADSAAFKALMQHLHTVDAQDHTVLMMQVENEVGILGASRDHSAAADRAFADPVPAELMSYLATHRPSLNPELRLLWQQNGSKSHGTWTEVFGNTDRADEIFMAWQYARYVQAVAAAGKSAYPLPMYANAWLGGGDTPPGNYPSGGPQPRVLDVWKAAGSTLPAGSSLDMESPDLYAAGFADWCQRYHRPDNPLFIPETNGGSSGAANVFYAVGEQAVLGFSPFAIDGGLHGGAAYPNAEAAAKGRADLTESYQTLASILPELTPAQAAGNVHGFILDKSHPSVDFVMHDVTVHVSLDEIFGHQASSGYGLILEEAPDSFLGAGRGFRVSFTPRDDTSPRIGLASVIEGRFDNGTWVPGRHLNGDESDQGNFWRFDQRQVHIERAALYRYNP
jgi:beta-galactosidase GanA